MTRLFDLAAEYRQAAETLADLDLPDEVVRDTLDGMSGELEVKATNIVAMTQEWEALVVAMKDAEGKIAARRKALENRAARVRRYLLDGLLYAGVQKIETPLFRIAVRDNPAAVDVFQPELVPADFMRAPEPPPPAPNKAAIKAALAAGQDVPGARLVQSKRLEVR